MTQQPVDNLKGRWQPGGGKNGPVKVQVRLPEQQGREVKRKFEICGFPAKLNKLSPLIPGLQDAWWMLKLPINLPREIHKIMGNIFILLNWMGLLTFNKRIPRKNET